MRKEKILISGPNGLLGSNLIHCLSNKYEVHPLDVDIRDIKNLKKFNRKKFDWIIHTAALTDVHLCEKDNNLCRNTNVSGTRNVLNLAKKVGARFIHISTASVFSGFEGNYKENDLPCPQNFYNNSKASAEEIVKTYDKSLILRLNIVGIHPNGSRGKNFFEWLIDSIKNNKDLRLFMDVVINPLSPQTIAEIIYKLLNLKIKDKILHMGSSNNMSKADIAKLVMGRLDFKGNVKFISVDEISNVPHPKQMWLNTDRIQKDYGIRMPTLESEVDKILEKHLIEILEEEFQKCFEEKQEKLPTDLEAIVVLSYGAGRKNNTRLVSRTEYGLKLAKELPNKPLLVFNAYKTQLSFMKKIAKRQKFKDTDIYSLYCGAKEIANTKTQCESLVTDEKMKTFNKILILTNTYHVPRLTRVLSKILPENIKFYVRGIPGDNVLYDKEKEIAGEIRRTIKYSKSGENTFYPRQ